MSQELPELAAAVQSRRSHPTPPSYAAITRGSRMIAFSGGLHIFLGIIALVSGAACFGFLCYSYLHYQPPPDPYGGALYHPRGGWISGAELIATGGILGIFVGPWLIYMGIVLRMLAALSLAIRDTAINSFRL